MDWLSFIPFVGNSLSAVNSLLSTFNFSSITQPVLDTINSSFSSITNITGSAFFGILASILSLLPEGGTFPTIVHTSSESLGSVLGSVDFIFPIYDLIYILLLGFTIKFLLFSIRLITWAVSLIRGGGGFLPL